MSARSKNSRTIGFLLVTAGLILACGLGRASPASAPAVDATAVMLQLQGTAMSLELTQAALSSALATQLPAPSAAFTEAVPATESGTQAAPTGSEPLTMPLEGGAVEISYGQTLSHYPRKSAGILYGFRGAEGDIVSIVLKSSNARPNDPSCADLTSSTTFTLRTPSREIPATLEGAHLSSIKDFELPGSAAYYVVVTCGGSACNGYCTEADLVLEKK